MSRSSTQAYMCHSMFFLLILDNIEFKLGRWTLISEKWTLNLEKWNLSLDKSTLNLEKSIFIFEKKTTLNLENRLYRCLFIFNMFQVDFDSQGHCMLNNQTLN